MARRKSNTISPSQLDAQSCRLSWYLGYKKGYSPKRSSLPLEFGTGIHYALEMYYSKKEEPDQAFDRWVDRRIRELSQYPDAAMELEESRRLGKGMLKGYREEYPKETFKVLATEHNVKRKLPAPEGCPEIDAFVSVRLDGLVRDDETGRLFSLEHKTFERFQPGFLDRDHQMTAQVFAGQSLADSMGLEESVYGVIYNGLRKQLPGPKVRNKLFERRKVYRNARQIDVFLHRAYHQYVQFQDPDLAIYPQPNMVRCSSCDFGGVCQAYMLGEDWKFLLRENYKRRS